MEMIKCDRCGKVDYGQRIHNFGFATMYFPSISVYYSPDSPIEKVDLCKNCYGELYGIVNKFMKECEKCSQ